MITELYLKEIAVALLILYVTVAANYLRFNKGLENAIFSNRYVQYILIFALAYLVIDYGTDTTRINHVVSAFIVVIIFSLTTSTKIVKSRKESDDIHQYQFKGIKNIV